MGRRDLVDVMNLFKNAPISLLIVIGVKAALLVKVELGIPGVFVSTHCYETDHNATVFLDNLYEGLLQKKSVKEAFEKSKAEFDLSIDKNNDNMCCCLHEHKPECNWHDIASTIGHSLAHRAFKHSSIESNDSQLKCKIQTSFLMAIGHNDSMNHCINQENLCCQEKSIHWKGK